MEEHIREDILQVLKGTVRALHRDDVKALKNLSNMTIHNASIHQDEDSISVSVLVYSLGKLFERDRYVKYASWQSFSEVCLEELQKAVRTLELRDDVGFERVIKTFLEKLIKTEKGLRRYIRDVLQRARISKASRLHEHGISLGRTAELLNISQYELVEYVGKTYIADVSESITLTERERMKVARSLFR